MVGPVDRPRLAKGQATGMARPARLSTRLGRVAAAGGAQTSSPPRRKTVCDGRNWHGARRRE
ncbi:hypothetical protein RGE_26960 [Rubrivivax gelatinosus IL144]|uniref:Uncharacterized protein n=1 Tax=Rubrivivax gelatinosus (strain NBRC 100245 / IL144) TaxID=983917 RepID=I0HSP8_RUBGI|nr:hypothetical protein RGE_26960 [Rubrivivax gelatinosus IL144]